MASVADAGQGRSSGTERGRPSADRQALTFPDGPRLELDQLLGQLIERAQEVIATQGRLRGLLRAMQVPSGQIPESVEAQAALYRSLLAGQRMLVLLDNVADADQVRPLLPGHSGCPVLITSRSELTGLVATEGAYPLGLDVLSASDACELLVGRLGAQRVMAEPPTSSRM